VLLLELVVAVIFVVSVVESVAVVVVVAALLLQVVVICDSEEMASSLVFAGLGTVVLVLMFGVLVAEVEPGLFAVAVGFVSADVVLLVSLSRLETCPPHSSFFFHRVEIVF